MKALTQTQDLALREAIAALVRAIAPHDELEREHITAAASWIHSGAPLFRVAKPDVPPQHLVAYFTLVDRARGRLLLVDHINAGLWLPNGGHVEPGEHPRATVRRELQEELGLAADFLHDDPLFLTVTQTVGATAGHTDVSLWYALRADSSQPLEFDRAEFHGVRWFDFASLPLDRADPHLGRFAAKLLAHVSYVA
jgi:ADP-ribose pyrophosphatase YjhB (NUDIX family)